MTKTRVTFKSEVHSKQVIGRELSNAHAHNAKHVLSFATLRKYQNPSDPLRSLIISPIPTKLHPITILLQLQYLYPCHLLHKLHLTKTHLNFNILNHSKQHMAASPYFKEA